MAYLAVFTRAALVLVFVMAAVGKLRSRRRYLSFVESLRLFVPARFVPAAAAAMLVAEVACAVLLVLPATSRLGSGMAAVLLAVVTGAVGWAVAAGRTASCQCFGRPTRPLSRIHVIRNSILLAVALIAVVGGHGPMHAGGAVLTAAAGAAGALLLIRMEDLLALWVEPPRLA